MGKKTRRRQEGKENWWEDEEYDKVDENKDEERTRRRRTSIIKTNKRTKKTTRWQNWTRTWLKTTMMTRESDKLINFLLKFHNQLTPFAVTFFCSISGAHSLSIRTSSTLCRSIPSGTVCVFWTELTAFDLIQVITRVAWICWYFFPSHAYLCRRTKRHW